MDKTLKVTLITLLSFGAYFFLDELYFKSARTWLHSFINQYGISHIISYLVFGIPIFIGVLLLHRKEGFFNSLGFNRSIIKAMVFSLLCTLPMFIGFAFIFDFNSEVSLNTILISVIAAGFFEELYFRGFLFGQLFRYSRFGFILSVLLGALLFGFAHLYQGNELGEIIGIFLVTFLGGILFAWVYAEWNYNIWVPIFLHMLMNLSWELFSVSDNALGGIYSNVFRIITILLIIVLTILQKRRKGIGIEVNKKTILMKSKNWLQHRV